MKILGIMSGSSLDGIDLALCEFEKEKSGIRWQILRADTIEYSGEWKEKLKTLPRLSGRELTLADYHIGYLFGKEAKRFLGNEKIDFIASHGHTVFHEPDNMMTLQIGNGSAIASASGISTIYDFRSMDIGFGGQGAPVVPIADRDLFPGYNALVNIGGISNISIKKLGEIFAYDISPANQLLNFLARKKGKEYDKNGEMASKGKVSDELMKKLLSFDYFEMPYPKSLDNNFIKNNFIPILEKDTNSIEDKMATCVEFIAKTMADELKKHLETVSNKKVLITGGGAKNTFLIKRITAMSEGANIVVPDDMIIDFKEALMIAYMGYLRINKKNNVLSSVTGASRDSIGGAVCVV